MQMYLGDIFTVPAPLAGCRALGALRLRRQGLPVGLQLMGDYFSEAALLGIRAPLSAGDRTGTCGCRGKRRYEMVVAVCALLPALVLADESRELVGQVGSRSALMVLARDAARRRRISAQRRVHRPCRRSRAASSRAKEAPELASRR